MREITIPSTKAAYDRLALLREPERLILPWDGARIAPFGLDWAEKDGKRVLRLLYHDIAVGAVLRHADGQFRVRVALPPSEKVDLAVERVFTVVRDHLDQVSRLMAAEARQQRLEQNAAEAQCRRVAERAAEAQRAAAAAEISARQALEKRRRAYMGYETPEKVARPIVLAGVTPEMAAMAAKHSAEGDAFNCVWAKRTFVLQTPGRAIWRFRNDRGVIHIDGSNCEFTPDAEKVAGAIRHLAERNARLQDPVGLRTVLTGLPAQRYSLTLLGLNSPESSPRAITDIADLGRGFTLSSSYNSIYLKGEGVRLLWWIVKMAGEDGQPEILLRENASALHDDEAMNASLLERVGSLWIGAAFRAEGKDPEPYAVPDIAKIEDEVAAIDFGYTF